MFRDLGVDRVVSGGQTMNPSTQDILKEIEATPAEVVYVLPNNKNIIMAAEQCVPLAPGQDRGGPAHQDHPPGGSPPSSASTPTPSRRTTPTP